MTDLTTTEVERVTWQDAYEQHLTSVMTEWAESARGNLDEAMEEFVTKTGERTGWYGYESPFSYNLRWRAEDMLKAELTTAVAYVVERELEEHTATEVLAELKKDMRQLQAKGLETTSTGLMWNTLETLRGRAALDFAEGGWSGMARWEGEAHFAALTDVAGTEYKAVNAARDAWRETKSKMTRVRSDASRDKLQAELDLNVMGFEYAVDQYVARLVEAGAPDTERPPLDRSY